MNRFLLPLLSSVLVLLLISCGSSSSDERFVDFNSDWTVAFLSVIDECGLLEAGIEAFEDIQSVVVRDGIASVSSTFLPNGTYLGTQRAPDSLLVEFSVDGNLFGDGVFCEVIEDLAYNSAENLSAEVLYNIRIQCADGFVCNSTLRGLATR